jgi:hypothetical protein
MGTNIHERHRAASGHGTPPSGRDDDDTTHALQAGKKGPSPRKSAHGQEPSTRDEGRDDRRPGSETGKPDR